MNTNKVMARKATWIYLALAVFGAFSLLYVPSEIIVKDDAVKTIFNIQNSETLFRIGFFTGLIYQVLFILLGVSLFNWLKPVDKNHALLMLVFVLVSIPISMLNMLNQYAVLELLSDAEYFKAIANSELNFKVMFHIELFNGGILIAQIFWGLWLYPFGILIYKSRFLPKFIGIWLILGCFGYLISSTAAFLFPNHQELVEPFTMIMSFGEIVFIFWVLLRGVKESDRSE